MTGDKKIVGLWRDSAKIQETDSAAAPEAAPVETARAAEVETPLDRDWLDMSPLNDADDTDDASQPSAWPDRIAPALLILLGVGWTGFTLAIATDRFARSPGVVRLANTDRHDCDAADPARGAVDGAFAFQSFRAGALCPCCERVARRKSGAEPIDAFARPASGRRAKTARRASKDRPAARARHGNAAGRKQRQAGQQRVSDRPMRTTSSHARAMSLCNEWTDCSQASRGSTTWRSGWRSISAKQALSRTSRAPAWRPS